MKKLSNRSAAGVLALLASASLLPAAQAAVPARIALSQLTSTGPSCTGGGSYYPSTDAQGRKVAFTSWCDLVPGQNGDGNSELFIMNSDASGLKQLTHTVGGLGATEPDLSQAGDLIVFASEADLLPGQNSDGNNEIFLIHADGTGLLQLTHTTGGRVEFGFAGNTHPIFGPSGQHITFSSDRDLVPGGNADGNNDLFEMNVDGGGLRQLTFTTGGWGVNQGSLDKTGHRVLFDADRDLVAGQNVDLGSEIFVMNTSGSGLEQLTRTDSATQIGNTFARWTPDGQSIFFASDADPTGGNADANYEVFHMNGDGSAVVQITACTGGFGSVPWDVASQGGTVAIESDCDLVPGANTDRNGEIYLEKWTPALFDDPAPAGAARARAPSRASATIGPRRPVVPRF